jgi:N-acetylmuramoyl-L-alanine amidase
MSVEPYPPYFTDLTASLPVKPPNQMHASSTRVIPATKPLSRPGSEAPSAALASENASRSLTRALGLKVNRIVIDAGHGGHDFGTIGPNGVLEKDVVLDVALRVSKLVQERMGAEVVLTRSDDTFIPLHERTAIANDHKADLFLSIHANSSPAPEVAGTETFFLNFTNSPDALNVAARENAGADKNVGELKDLIQSITLNDKIEESHTFAEDIQNSIQAQAARSNAAARNRGVKRAPFVVLIGASMPSVLAEIGFLSNSRDESNLGKPEYRQKIAEALYKGLGQYAQSLSHFEPSRQIAKTVDSKTSEKPLPAGLN